MGRIISLLVALITLTTSNFATENNAATVFVYRYKQFLGSALEPSIYCDESQLARMDNGRYFVVSVAPGQHVFRANDAQSGVELDAKPGEKYYIRMELVTGMMKGHGRLVAVPAEQGAYEIKKLALLSADKVKNPSMVLVNGNVEPHATSANVLTNGQIVALAKGGFGDEVVITKIKSSPTAFKLDTSDLLMLKNSGVSDAIVTAMVEAQPAASK